MDRPRPVPRALRHLRVRHHDRLPPHADAPRVRGCAPRSRPPSSSPDRSRSRDRLSTGRSTTAPTTPTPTRRATRTARTTASRAARSAPSRACCTRTWAGSSGTTAPTGALRQGHPPGPADHDGLAPLPAVGGAHVRRSRSSSAACSRCRGRARSPASSGAASCASSSTTTSRGASTRSATSSASGRSRRATSRRTTGCWRCRRSASRGTTTITSSPRRPSTGCRWRQIDLSALDHRRLGEDRARPERSQADVGADRAQADGRTAARDA